MIETTFFAVFNSLGQVCYTTAGDGIMRPAIFLEIAPAQLFADDMEKRNGPMGRLNKSITEYVVRQVQLGSL